MNNQDLNIIGKFSQKGGMIITEKDELYFFGKQNSGKKFLLNVTVLPEETSKLLITYYYKGIVPQFKKVFSENGEHLTLSDVDVRLREMSPMMHEEIYEDGFHLERLKTINEVGNKVARQYVDHIKMIGAEMGILIVEPKAD